MRQEVVDGAVFDGPGHAAADRFRAQVCELASIVLDCENKLKLDVKVFPDFDSIDLTPGIGDDGEVDDAGFTFEPGHGSDIVVVRADRTTEADLRETIGLLSGCDHVGLILNGAGIAVSGRKFGAYDGYGHDH